MEGEKKNIVGGAFVMDMTSIQVTDLSGEWKDKWRVTSIPMISSELPTIPPRR